MTYVIRTPNPDFAGVRAGLTFQHGRAETDDPAAADYCRYILGYTVEQIDITGGPVPTPKPTRAKRNDE